jgi:gluconokinase
MRVLVMGVAGSGKSTLGAALGEALGLPFLDADDLHDAAARAAMAAGRGLDDAARAPWLGRVRTAMDDLAEREGGVVLACSALKAAYRARLSADRVIFLDLTPQACVERLAARQGHFAGPSIAASQFEALEPPTDALMLDALAPLGQSLAACLADLGSASQSGNQRRLRE